MPIHVLDFDAGKHVEPFEFTIDAFLNWREPE